MPSEFMSFPFLYFSYPVIQRGPKKAYFLIEIRAFPMESLDFSNVDSGYFFFKTVDSGY